MNLSNEYFLSYKNITIKHKKFPMEKLKISKTKGEIK